MTVPEVVIAEEDGSLRLLLAEALTERDVRVLQAADGAQAMQLLEGNPGVSVLLSDVKMPVIDGYTLGERALKSFPELKVLIMTAYAGEKPPPALLAARELRILIKPVRLDKMCDLVCDMLARP